jgi:hypothetical protein
LNQEDLNKKTIKITYDNSKSDFEVAPHEENTNTLASFLREKSKNEEQEPTTPRSNAGAKIEEFSSDDEDNQAEG